MTARTKRKIGWSMLVLFVVCAMVVGALGIAEVTGRWEPLSRIGVCIGVGAYLMVALLLISSYEPGDCPNVGRDL